MSALHFRLFGDFSVTSSDGKSLTPKSKKAIGLLALLATSDTGSRQRRWLEDKLWSDRGSEQARGSLRTTLVGIRRALGPLASVLGSDRTAVWLCLSQIKTDLEAKSSERDFLEGLDINDDEFNAWMIHQRVMRDDLETERPAPLAPERKISIQCGQPWSATSKGSAKSRIVDTQVGKIIADFVAASRCTVSNTRPDLIVQTSVDEDNAGTTIFVEVIDPKHDVIVHSDHCFVSNIDRFVKDPTQLGRFCWNLADIALEKLPPPTDASNELATRAGFVQTALQRVLSFEPDQMREGIWELDMALAHMEGGLFMALKAWAMTAMIMEGFEAETIETLDEIQSLIVKARELSPSEGIVAAVVANVQSTLFEDHNEAISMARRALRENPNSIFALQGLSNSRAASGQAQAAYEISKQGQTIAAFSKFAATCNLHHALLCIAMHRTDEAIKSSNAAADLAPQYRAPRRQLLALYAAEKNVERAHSAVEDLQLVEPDFHLDRYLFDRSYPSNTLRKSGYLSNAVDGLKDM
jgi:DNA-binding SARP family transcriptional activator